MDATKDISSSRKTLNWTLHMLEDQWFIFALGLLILISSQVQVPASQQETKETIVTYTTVSVVFLITGLQLSTEILVQNYARWKLHLFVQVQCYLMTSVITFGIVSLCATSRSFMDPGLLIGMIFTSSLPTTIASNVVMTRQAHGNDALTVVETTIGNFLGPFLAPLIIQMYTSSGAWYTHWLPSTSGDYGGIYKRVFKQLGLSMFLPMAVGQVVRYFFPKSTKKVIIDWKIGKLSPLSMLTIVWSTFDQAFRSGVFESVKSSNMIFICFITVVQWTAYLVICVSLSLLWLSKKDVIAVAYCVPAKTAAIGVPLATVMWVGLSIFDKTKLQVPQVIYLSIQIAFGGILVPPFRKWAKLDETTEDIEKSIGNEVQDNQLQASQILSSAEAQHVPQSKSETAVETDATGANVSDATFIRSKSDAV